MKVIKILLISFLITSCGKMKTEIDPEFENDYREFIAEANVRDRQIYGVMDFSIHRGSTTTCGNVIACCSQRGDAFSNKAEIIVKQDFVFVYPLYKKATIWHELGHCLMGKKHDARLNENGMPISLMNPEIPSNTFLEAYWGEYLNQLFSYENP